MDTITIPPLLTPVAKPLMQPRQRPILLDPSIVAYYDFTRAAKLEDLSQKGNRGSIVGATYVAKGRNGPALLFDGVDDYVEITHATSIDFHNTTPFSYAGWVKINVTGGTQCLVGKRNIATSTGWVIVLQLDKFLINFIYIDELQITVRSQATYTSTTQWYFFVLTYSGNNLATGVKLYVNGAVVADDDVYAGPSLNVQTTVDVTLGLRNAGGAFPFNGLMDEVILLNRVLTANEIARMYEAGAP